MRSLQFVRGWIAGGVARPKLDPIESGRRAMPTLTINGIVGAGPASDRESLMLSLTAGEVGEAVKLLLPAEWVPGTIAALVESGNALSPIAIERQPPLRCEGLSVRRDFEPGHDLLILRLVGGMNLHAIVPQAD